VCVCVFVCLFFFSVVDSSTTNGTGVKPQSIGQKRGGQFVNYMFVSTRSFFSALTCCGAYSAFQFGPDFQQRMPSLSKIPSTRPSFSCWSLLPPSSQLQPVWRRRLSTLRDVRPMHFDNVLTSIRITFCTAGSRNRNGRSANCLPVIHYHLVSRESARVRKKTGIQGSKETKQGINCSLETGSVWKTVTSNWFWALRNNPSCSTTWDATAHSRPPFANSSSCAADSCYSCKYFSDLGSSASCATAFPFGAEL
jgi:hypothetical protein